MDDSFTVKISSNLVNQLVSNGEKLKKKTKKSKPKGLHDIQQSPAKFRPKELIQESDARKEAATEEWPVQHPIFLPVSPPPPPPSANAELSAIRSVLLESERVVERLKKHEEEMVKEVTQKAKNLHDEEFKLPLQKPMPCLTQVGACLDCYKEYANNPLKCAQLVKNFADCARRARQQVGSPTMEAS